jgi:DNA-directed RNA polymerase specialized sigma24 family protein
MLDARRDMKENHVLTQPQEGRMSGFDTAVERWSADEQFREDFRADPEAAIDAAGITLSDEERETVRSFDLSGLSDAELQERVNKMVGC